MKLDEEHPLNQLVLRNVKDKKGIRFDPRPIVSPDEHHNPYLEAGCHPDIVERLWETIGSSLPADCRALVYGNPALVHPTLGIVFAWGLGTGYAIRIPDEAMSESLEAGCETECEEAGGGKVVIGEVLGKGWIIGCWKNEEMQWLTRMYFELSKKG